MTSPCRAAADSEVPASKLILLRGAVLRKETAALKNDWCCTIVMSCKLASRDRGLFGIRNERALVHYSRRHSKERRTKEATNATVQIGGYGYFSSWIVADCRYNSICSMPWHTDANPSGDYRKISAVVNGYTLPTQAASARVEKLLSRNSVLCRAENEDPRKETLLS